MKKLRRVMESHGVPSRDCYELESSKLTFEDGCQYRIEISGVERLSTLEALVEEMEERDVPVHRLISTVLGSTLLLREELSEFSKLASEKKLEVIITPGPRSFWDLGKQIATPEGALSGLRVRGSDMLSYLLADIRRCIDLGFRGFLIWDEGVLWLLNEMRKNGEIPKDVVFKVSIFAGHANAAGAKVLESLGADTFNPVADLSLPMLSSIRKAVKIPMDLHVYLFDSMGGFVRFWECAELARICSPCYFKIEPGPSVGALYKPWVSEDSLAYLAREKVKYAEIIRELVQKVNPDLKLSRAGPKDLAIPKV
ncbi:MAG: hypothetical protein ACE5HW_04295 [Candidatus Methanofastidiosia archaeon]